MKKILLSDCSISLMFVVILLLFSFSCNDSPSDESKSEPQVEVEQVQESDSAQDFGLEGGEPSDEVSIDLDSNAPRYWYVYYMARRKSDESEWSGYKVIKMNESYFDIYKARKILYPSCVDEDYIGIQFFKEVSEKTYVEFNNKES